MGVNFYIEKTEKIVTETMLFQGMGYPSDLAHLRKLGVFPVKYDTPVFDPDTQKLVKKDKLVKDDTGLAYIQQYSIVKLNKAEKEAVQEQKKEAKFKELRTARTDRLEEYDTNIAQLQRQLRLATSDTDVTEIQTKIAAWDTYAEALCNLPSNAKAPWVGEQIPWPIKPNFVKE